MTDDCDRTEREVRTTLPEEFARREIAAIRPAGPSWNDLNETVRVDFADGDSVFLKTATDGDSSRIRRECAVIDYVGTHCDVAVPTVLSSGADGDLPALVTAPMQERTLASQWKKLGRSERTTALRQIGRALAEIHSQTFDQHGHIVDGDSEGLVCETGSWSSVLVDRIEMMRTVASSDRFERYYEEVATVVERNQERLDCAPAALVYGDPAMPNIFRSESTLGFVDWELAHIGDPARELHRARSQLLESRDLGDEKLADALEEGYRRQAGSLPTGLTDRSPIYDAVRYLGTVGFVDKIAEFSDEPVQTVAARVETEMNDRLDAVQ